MDFLFFFLRKAQECSYWVGLSDHLNMDWKEGSIPLSIFFSKGAICSKLKQAIQDIYYREENAEVAWNRLGHLSELVSM